MPMVSKTVVFHVIHVGQDLNQGGHGAWGDVCAVGAHLGNACSFGNHLMGFPSNPGCAWTCWPEVKARLPGHSSIFPCCLRKPPVTWHSQRCHLGSASLPEHHCQHQPSPWLGGC